uniref:Uncharacterized protein n=1 Tax=Clytia hemisphaerica TaxID=252671 RepID=A0A7M5V9V8_9CNID
HLPHRTSISPRGGGPFVHWFGEIVIGWNYDTVKHNMSTPNGIVKQNAEYWIKLNLALEIHLKAVLFELLFNKHGNSIYVGLPTNQDLLQQYLIQFRRTKESYLKDFIDWDILCPKEGFTNLEQWNIALVIDVIIHILSIPTPLEGWDQQKPLPDDDSLSGMVLWSRWIHEKIKVLKVEEAGDHYHDMLTTLRYILKTLNYSDLQKFDESIQNDLKSQSIDMVKLFHGQERTEPSASPCKVDFVQKFEICSEILELTVCNGLSSTSPFLTNGSISPTQSASEHKKQPIESSEEPSNTNTSENSPNMLVNHSEPQPSSSKQPTESTDDFNFNNTSSIDSKPLNRSPLSNPEPQTTAQSITTKPNNERTRVPPPVATKPKRRTSQQNQERKLSNVVSSQQVDNQTHDSSDRRMSNGLLGQHRSETEFDLKGTILDEVYQIIADMLTRGEWESMLNTLQLSFKEKFNIFLSSRSIDVFKRRHLSWFDIRNRLLQLDRSDVIKAIKTKTYITEEFQSTLEYHKETLRQNHMTKRFVKPFLGASGEKELDDQNLEDAFVELAIIKGKNVDEKFLNSNRDYHLQQVLLDKQMISLDQLITKDERFVMISGIPGIGKSTLVKKVILDWDKRLLLSGKGPSPNIQILFPILCRELNTIDFTETSSHPLDILERLFPDFLPHWRLIKDHLNITKI